MAVRRAPRVGDIYWLDGCPSLSGEELKKRPVVIVASVDAEPAIQGILVVACTSSRYPSNTLAIELPSHPEGMVRSGLRKMTWAVPDWTVVVSRDQLSTRQGYISGELLDRLLKACFERYRGKAGD